MNLKKIKTQKELFHQFRCGLERETLRIDKRGELSTYSHPISLGSSLTHPYFVTDFAEAQLEWNTPPLSSLRSAKNFLEEVMSYTKAVNPKELFWPYSMPCRLPKKITKASYGPSHEGQTKELYRKGLCYRYGTNLQMISSLHFNFSFSTPVWDFLYDTLKPKESKREFINSSYFKMIRNFLSEGWILTYLFGASPAMDETYLDTIPKGFKKNSSTIYHPEATSIRMSYLGYYSRIQNQLTISFETLEKYLADIKSAISTPHPAYQKIGLKKDGTPIQINENFLQIENEHYGRIRPKTKLSRGETPLRALSERGVEYVEVRSIDVDPFEPLGISMENLLFLHQFLLYCLLKESKTLSKNARCSLIENQHRVALQGRKKGLILESSGPIPISDWASEILLKMKPLAKMLDGNKPRGYLKNLIKQESKVANPDLTPSSRILSELENESLRVFGLKWARVHQKKLRPLSVKKKNFLKQTTQKSLDEKQTLETASEILLKGHENLELSTQILMKEALNQGIEVKVLDIQDNLIKLTKGKRTEYIKQATKTSLDSYIIPELMGNKHVTKLLLRENGFSVPVGKLYTSIQEAVDDYSLYQMKKVVVKPKSTNFGIGISFALPKDKKGYLKAIKEAFLHDDTILIEDFHSGKEYRFLVIDYKTVGVIHRVPAHVVGNGVHTIKELVFQKNHDPNFYRDSKTFLTLSEIEKEILEKQKLKPSSILPKGKKVFLRENSNVSTGGDAIDVTDKIHNSYIKLAENATRSMNAKICGIDIMISKPSKRATDHNYAIIELNYNPVLFFHAFPNKGKKRNVARPILKLLGF